LPYPRVVNPQGILVFLVDSKACAHRTGFVLASIVNANAFVGYEDAGHLEVIGTTHAVTQAENSLDCLSSVLLRGCPPKAEGGCEQNKQQNGIPLHGFSKCSVKVGANAYSVVNLGNIQAYERH
jgi:hypothetical protein